MEIEGRLFAGTLYTGIMLTNDGPKVLEYNCRFGDPETQVSLPLLETDLLEIILASISGSLGSINVKWKNQVSVCVVIASGGYPNKYEKGKPIDGLDHAAKVEGIQIFHAGTALEDGNIVTNGGRVLGINAIADDYPTVIKRAYGAVSKIHFDGMDYRTDIGFDSL